jgi:hypothetical protein
VEKEKTDLGVEGKIVCTNHESSVQEEAASTEAGIITTMTKLISSLYIFQKDLYVLLP